MNGQSRESALANLLESILTTLDKSGHLDDSQNVTPYGDRQANAIVSIEGVTYSLTLTRED